MPTTRPESEPSPDRGAGPARRLPLLVACVAAALFVIGTIGPPLVGKGVFLTSDLVYLGYPWKALEDPAALQTSLHGPTSDTVDASYPARARFGEDLRGGDFTGWNPWTGGGEPLGATSSAGMLNPLAAPFVLFPAWFAPAVVKLLGLACAIGFTYLFCRRLGTGKVPAVFGGVAFAGSGFLVMWTNWPQADVASLIPAVFWATERFLQKRTPGSVVPIALALGAMLLGTFPAVAGFALYVLGTYVLVRLLVEHRTDVCRLAGGAAGVGGGVLAGVMLVAVVLLPCAARLGDDDLSNRAQGPDANLGVPTLLTAVAPEAFGLSSEGQVFRGPARNQVESIAFVGATTALLALAAVALPGARRTPRGARAALAGTTVVLGAATFAGGPLLTALQVLPVFTDNYVGRTRSVLGLTVAALGALGLQALVERGRLRSPLAGFDRRRWLTIGGVALGAAAVAGFVLVRSVQWVRPYGGGAVLGSSLRLPALVGVLAVGAVAALVLAPRTWMKAGAVAVLPVLLVVESLALSLPLLPNESRDTLYPETAAERFLQDNVGHGRLAMEGQTFYGNSPMLAGIRTVSGHAFHAPTWKDMLHSADPQVFASSPTLAFVHGEEPVATATAFDRLGVDWFATTPERAPYGRTEAAGLAGAACPEGPGSGGTEGGTESEAGAGGAGDGPSTGPDAVPVPAGDGLRGVVVRVCEDTPVPAGARVVVEAEGSGEAASGTLRVRGQVPAGDLTLAVPAEGLAGDVLSVSVALEGADGAELPLATGTDGRVALDLVRPADDGLRLAFADELRIYERTGALPRVRWAGRSEVVTDRAESLARVTSGDLPADTVVLGAGAGGAESDGDEGGSGAAADVEIVSDGPDDLAIDVQAEGDGYLVVADALQEDWAVTVDGEAAELVPGDHAGVAVAVPEGTHRVELKLAPRGRTTGALLGVVAAAGLAAAWFVARRRRRPAPEAASAGDDAPASRNGSGGASGTGDPKTDAGTTDPGSEVFA
jgi:hypothetical protein